jgi:hypothetical protein
VPEMGHERRFEPPSVTSGLLPTSGMPLHRAKCREGP